ncbi:MAG: sulfotransferase [Kiritimatiellia bacterium]
MKEKVFCLGFHKTGTSSLALALKKLGYRVTGAHGIHDPDIAENVLPMVRSLVSKYDAFQDNPWPIIYKELDHEYPGSKFILLLRDPESWIKSQVKYFGSRTTAMREWIYGVGCPEGNEDVYLKRFMEHNEEVTRYFKDRPDDLLVMNLAEGDGWEKLCPFLGVDVPDIAFPHANKISDRESKLKARKSPAKKVSRFIKKVMKRYIRPAFRPRHEDSV